MAGTEIDSNSSKLKEKMLPSEESSETLPRKFGRLTLLRRVARGGMGEVYLAATRGIEGAERACVVKKIRREHQDDKSFRARFLDETRVQAQLQHPGVAQILEAATDEDECPYAVVEYIEGRHLGEILSRSNQLGVPLNWADADAIGLCFADALAHVHERMDPEGRPLQIAHRDLSPQNVMVGYAGDVKLIDFGTARGENRRCRTVSGIVYAKPGYVAPEVANQIPGGAPADIYALGVMIWEIVAGRRFLQGDAVEHQAQVAHGNRPLPAIAQGAGAPKALDTVLAKATATEVSDRYPSARKMVTDLVDLLKSGPSLADGDRSVRGRIAHMMQRLYPAEPARSRADFARRVAHARETLAGKKIASARPGIPEPSPVPQTEIEESEDLLSGTRYRLMKTLSRGTMGEVWQATHVDLGRDVALKIMPENAAQSGDARQRFRSEARALARLDHPGLVNIHDFGVTAQGRCYYAMELLHGETLEHRLARGPMSWREAVRLTIEAAEALGAAHEAGIVHRDITPSNLFLTTDGTLKLLDFGVSRHKEHKEEEGDGPAVVGTPEYISPEQAAGGKADVRSDIYALGVVFYEMLTGRVPHPLGEAGSSTLPALLTAKISVTPRAPSVVAVERGVPSAVDRVVVKMLERCADKRLSSTDEVLRALGSLEARQLEKPKRKNVTLMSAAAALLSVALFTFVLAGQKPEMVASRTVNLDELAQESATASAPLSDQMEEAPGETESTQVLDLDEPGSGKGPKMEQAENTEHALIRNPLDEEVDRIVARAGRGNHINAHHQMKLLDAKFPQNVSVARGLVSTAQGVKAWGEAFGAAKFWLDQTGDPEAGVAFAKLQKATLRGNPVETLRSVLQSHPDFEPARELLGKYEENKVAAR